MKSFDQRPVFWVAYVLFAIVCLAVAWRVFPEAMPIVHLDVTMTRQQAVDEARALASKLALAPADARTAIVFNEDGATQSYVELEGGGKDAFAKLVAGKVYAPYWWEVRLFKLGVIDETTVRFRPDGARNGFSRRVAETYVRDEATKALAADAALGIAKERAHADWEIDFGPYKLLDQSQQTRPSGRVDHSFVFEREGALGEARIRLSLEVSGDELTEVEPYVHVPESFGRRFQELRSANNAIAGVASVVAGILYGLVGIVIGGLLLFRGHALELRRSLIAGLVVGALSGAALLANAQAAWFAFPTTQTESNFWVGQAGRALLALIGGGLALGVSFMAAEGLTRRAFPHHPQLWRVWSREAAPTPAILGRTAGGYLFVPVELAFIALFYALTNRYLGWWQPSEQLTDPNILASAVPALSPIAAALQAGMMEECVFRGIPLAIGALIGARYGRRTLGIAIAFVLQALVFGAAHANYPGFPSYSRMVELVLPSLAWALIFLRYGLVPTMILHAVFDLVLMSIPIFLVDAPSAGLQRGIVIAAGALPMLVVLAWRMRTGAWTPFPDALRNGAWIGRRAAPSAGAQAQAPAGTIDRHAATLQRALPVLGVAGVAAWIAFTPLHADVPALEIDRAQAIAIAEAAIARRGAALGAEWDRMAVPRQAIEDSAQRQWHAYVWREAGPQAYRALVGGALAPPLWEVRFARFAGDVAERAEEWRVTVTGDGKVRAVGHRLPEARKGATLPRADAQALAERTLREQFGADPQALTPRGADEYQRPARKDWEFAYADPRVDVGKGGEARMRIAIAGDDVAVASRSMYVPESWQRAESERDAQRQVLRLVAFGVIAVASIAALVFAMVAWARGRSRSAGARAHERVRLRHDARRQHQRVADAGVRVEHDGAGREPAPHEHACGGGRCGVRGAADRARRRGRDALRAPAGTGSPAGAAAGVGLRRARRTRDGGRRGGACGDGACIHARLARPEAGRCVAPVACQRRHGARLRARDGRDALRSRRVRPADRRVDEAGRARGGDRGPGRRGRYGGGRQGRRAVARAGRDRRGGHVRVREAPAALRPAHGARLRRGRTHPRRRAGRASRRHARRLGRMCDHVARRGGARMARRGAARTRRTRTLAAPPARLSALPSASFPFPSRRCRRPGNRRP